MKTQSIKSITFIRLVQIFFIAILTISLVMFFAYKEFFKLTVQNKAIEIAEVVEAGLTSHMKAGIMDKRHYFLNELKNIHDIKSIYIIRGESVVKQFGTSSQELEKSYTDVSSIINLSEPSFEWKDEQGVVKAIIPYKVTSESELNCLSCHNAVEGETLGALEIEIDIHEYQELTFGYGYLLISLLVFFAFVIIILIFKFIEKYLSKPLSSIVQDADNAYKKHDDIAVESYEVSELQSLATNLNDFNHDIIDNEKALEQKNEELKLLNIEIESTLREMMIAIGQIEESRSNDLKNHTQRVALLSSTIARDLGLSDEDVKLIEMTSPLHDIGKIGISDAILLKPDSLDEVEFKSMQAHAQLGYNVLKHSERLVLKTAAQIAYGHHEKYDGIGYPQGLKGEEIPLFARIVAVVDVCDALLCKRVYKEAWNKEEVLALLLHERGKHFDPVLIDLVEKNFDRYSRLIMNLIEKNNS